MQMQRNDLIHAVLILVIEGDGRGRQLRETGVETGV